MEYLGSVFLNCFEQVLCETKGETKQNIRKRDELVVEEAGLKAWRKFVPAFKPITNNLKQTNNFVV